MNLEKDDSIMFTNQICSLPCLKNCKLKSCCTSKIYFNEDSTVSPILEALLIHSIVCPVNATDLLYLFVCASQLRFPSIYAGLSNQMDTLPSFQTLITSLRLWCTREAFELDHLFQSTLRLRHLTIHMGSIFLDGHQWKQTIIKYLPNLKTLHFTTIASLHGITEIDQKVEG